jgi:hypothetical protein
VDDAIVVVETRTHHERGRFESIGGDAQSDGAISGAIIGVTVMIAVFVPLAFCRLWQHLPPVFGGDGDHIAFSFLALSLTPRLRHAAQTG